MQTNSILNSSEAIQKFRSQLLHWYDQSGRSLPWRVLWEQKRDPYAIWVSEIMLQQTVIAAVLAVYNRFMKRFPTVFDLAKASEADVREAVRGLGYYRRFRFMHAAAQQLAEKDPFQWPKNFSEWKTLPGVGDYTAAAICSITLGEAVAVVDGNVERVLCRLFDIHKPSNDRTLKAEHKKVVQELLDVGRSGDFNQAMMEVGQHLCRPTLWKCDSCPLAFCCLSLERKTQHLAPAPKIKEAKVKVRMRLALVRHGTRFAIYRRPTSAKFLASVGGFLTLMKREDSSPWEGDGFSLDDFCFLNRGLKELSGNFRHNITKHQILVDTIILEAKDSFESPHWSWQSIDEIEPLLLSNLDRKAWNLYLKNSHNHAIIADSSSQR